MILFFYSAGVYIRLINQTLVVRLQLSSMKQNMQTM